MPPSEGDDAPGFEALLCDGETFRAVTLEGAVDGVGAMFVFIGFAFNVVSDNWWRRYERAGWGRSTSPSSGSSATGRTR